jgi:tetratricopeptide (TPR) repeat protein
MNLNDLISCLSSNNTTAARQVYEEIKTSFSVRDQLFYDALIRQVSGDTATAIEQYKKILKNDAGDLPVLINIATLHNNQDNFQEALLWLKKVDNPKHFEDTYRIALFDALFGLKEYDKAQPLLDALLKKEPNSRDLIKRLIHLRFETDRKDEAINLVKDYLKKTNTADAYFLSMLAKIYSTLDKNQQAQEYIDQALAIEPHSINFKLISALNLNVLGRSKEAIPLFEDIRQAKEYSDSLFMGLVRAYIGVYSYESAIEYGKQSIELYPDHSGVHLAYADALSTVDFKKAITIYQKSLELDVNDFLIPWHYSVALIGNGMWDQGWHFYKTGFFTKSKQRGTYLFDTEREWQKHQSTDKLIVWGEQGLGDIVMFFKFLKYIPDTVTHIEVHLTPKLIEVMQKRYNHRHDVRFVPIDVTINPECHIPIGNLPALFHQQYLEDPDHLLPFLTRKKKSHLGKLKVGITWRGGHTERNQRKRSVPMAFFYHIYSILNHESLELVSLQYNAMEHEIEYLSKLFGSRISFPNYDPMNELDKWVDDIEQCDSLLSVDNTAVHFAGAMGVPVLTLVPKLPDFRWGENSKQNPWYASVELIYGMDTLKTEEFVDVVKPTLQRKLNELLQNKLQPNYLNGKSMPFRFQEPTAKSKKLIELYTQMANQGYETTDNQKIEVAFSDMEIRAFQEHIKPLFKHFNIKTLLDYGCGGSKYDQAGFNPNNQSAQEYFELDEVRLYEPARNLDQRQKSDAVVNFDVLEHIFISDIPRVIRELFELTDRLLVVNVACYSARALLPNGENAHITVRTPHWWKGMFDAISIEYPEVYVQLYCSTGWRKVETFKIWKASSWQDVEGFTTILQ